MINRQQSLPMGSVININLTGNNSCLVPDDSLATTSCHVNITDPISSIFDAIGSTNRQEKIVFNGQILCPALSFAFYNIHNNDTLSIILTQMPTSTSYNVLSSNIPLKDHSSNCSYIVAAPLPIPISRKRTLFHSNSSNYFKNLSSNNSEGVKNLLCEKCNSGRKMQFLNEKAETARIKDVYKNRIESNSKSFRKLCTKFNDFDNSYPSNRIISQTPQPSLVSFNELNQETILPEKAELPSTDYLPEIKF